LGLSVAQLGQLEGQARSLRAGTPRSAFARLLTHFSPSAVKPRRVPPGFLVF
jgi:hypothetical protein